MYTLDNIALPIINDESKKLPNSMAKACVSSYSGEEFERFVLEWLKYCKNAIEQSTVIGQVGGKGDKGVDIYLHKGSETTYYQCKQYSRAINELELCEIVTKVLFYSYEKKSFMPTKLVIIAFSSFNGKALKLFTDKLEMKGVIIKNSETSLKSIKKSKPLDFDDYLANTDYSFVSKVDVDDIITEYYNSKYGKLRFVKSDYPVLRLNLEKGNYEDEEFVRQIKSFNPPISRKVLEETKEDYYSALCLKETDRHLFGNTKEFEKSKDEVYNTIKYKLFGYSTLESRMREALTLAASANTFHSYLDRGLNLIKNQDKQGMCHFLVNEKKFSWETEDE